ncbi:hypothetical protein KR51_00000470 [Rubidibacter lacunae KORDI 51-2]|uniref:Uncharacterized protein n=1 Tax=Rubidibacter lacunae KORDI 51-2 TaxID=582515 RepID=U5DU01_9CHRO|nr:hypothetical protein [Rubidibacter lacunae]ERN43155.1 hypothetical protein KR51_00000470 [Rubidibacter lacunae KORDI 51-2]
MFDLLIIAGFALTPVIIQHYMTNRLTIVDSDRLREAQPESFGD